MNLLKAVEYQALGIFAQVVEVVMRWQSNFPDRLADAILHEFDQRLLALRGDEVATFGERADAEAAALWALWHEDRQLFIEAAVAGLEPATARELNEIGAADQFGQLIDELIDDAGAMLRAEFQLAIDEAVSRCERKNS